MQTTINFSEQRMKIKKRLMTLQSTIYSTLLSYPEYRETKNRNDLIRYIWDIVNPDVSAESITRLQRKVIAEHPELDTKLNQETRANYETVYHNNL